MSAVNVSVCFLFVNS